MIDFTKNIQLKSELQKKYFLGRMALYLCFLLAALFVTDRILFPIVPLDYSFANINSLKNTIVAPRIEQTNQPSKSQISANDVFVFNANPIGHFSSAHISFEFEKKSPILTETKVELKKSYQAFFYPLGKQMGFKDGSLLTTVEGSYYIISNGLLRKFANTDIILTFGYAKNAFQLVEASDLALNPAGPDILNANTFPDDTLFAIGDTYYQMKNQQLLPFISQRAFLSQYDPIQAIAKDSNFLNNFPASETAVGFANGTLASSDQSVFILSNGKSYPIVNVNTFLAMGFNWDDIIALRSEELGLYEKQKQFNADQPHPDGTLFQDIESKKYFVIENGTKRPIENSNVLKAYAKQKAILADLSALDKKASCTLKKQLFSSTTYSCDIDLINFNNLLGNDYQIATNFENDMKIKSLNATFSTPISWTNFRSALSLLKDRLLNNYSQIQ
jgi:hypothetical protein